VRSFWCQREGHVTALVQRLCGSAELYQAAGRAPTDSVNLVTVHDGFTLHDLVGYNQKHNEANGEDNRDGEGHNRGWNCGWEGETDDELVQAQRRRLKRNLLATLFFSQGTPLLLGGDEIGRSQSGNNNGYCQDSAISWFDWTMTPEREQLLDFVVRLSALRRRLPALRRRRWFDGSGPDGARDITWRHPDGSEVEGERWNETACVGALLDGRANAVEADDDGEAETGDSVLLVVNGGDEPSRFTLPPGRWKVEVDTCTKDGTRAGAEPLEGDLVASGRSIVLLTQPLP
jgi:glycogen operon protein